MDVPARRELMGYMMKKLGWEESWADIITAEMKKRSLPASAATVQRAVDYLTGLGFTSAEVCNMVSELGAALGSSFEVHSRGATEASEARAQPRGGCPRRVQQPAAPPQSPPRSRTSRPSAASEIPCVRRAVLCAGEHLQGYSGGGYCHPAAAGGGLRAGAGGDG